MFFILVLHRSLKFWYRRRLTCLHLCWRRTPGKETQAGLVKRSWPLLKFCCEAMWRHPARCCVGMLNMCSPSIQVDYFATSTFYLATDDKIDYFLMLYFFPELSNLPRTIIQHRPVFGNFINPQTRWSSAQSSRAEMSRQYVNLQKTE